MVPRPLAFWRSWGPGGGPGLRRFGWGGDRVGRRHRRRVLAGHGGPVDGAPIVALVETATGRVLADADTRFSLLGYQSFDAADYEQFYAGLSPVPDDEWWRYWDNTKPGIDAVPEDGSRRSPTSAQVWHATHQGGAWRRGGALRPRPLGRARRPARALDPVVDGRSRSSRSAEEIEGRLWWTDQPAKPFPRAAVVVVQPEWWPSPGADDGPAGPGGVSELFVEAAKPPAADIGSVIGAVAGDGSCLAASYTPADQVRDVPPGLPCPSPASGPRSGVPQPPTQPLPPAAAPARPGDRAAQPAQRQRRDHRARAGAVAARRAAPSRLRCRRGRRLGELAADQHQSSRLWPAACWRSGRLRARPRRIHHPTARQHA